MLLSELRALIRYTVADATEWPDINLDAWVQQAMHFYSAHFPRRWRNTMTLKTGEQAYALPGGHRFLQLLAVQYPSTEYTYLRQVNEWDPAFEAQDDVYALRGQNDNATTVDPEDDSDAGYIVFAPTVATGQYAIIDYLGEHRVPGTEEDDQIVTVPNAHLEAITAYVEFMAHLASETAETAAVDATTVALAQLSDGARRTWTRYKDVMDRLTWLGANQAPNKPPCRIGHTDDASDTPIRP